MDLFQIVFLALIQGLTEFLPISSSAHLILPKEILLWPDQGLAFDVAVHFGSLIAVLAYFRKDVSRLIIAFFQQFGSRGQTPDSRLAWMVVIATIPAGIAGLLFNDYIETNFRTSLVIAITTILFGLVLWAADRRSNLSKGVYQIGVATALIIGVAQALALIPGTSRSGITITAALFLGFTRSDSARFSFLMAIPIIVLGAAFETLELFKEHTIAWSDIFLGAALSAVSAYLCIHYFLTFIERLGMLPFVVYRLLLGGALFAMLAFN
ncbi:undecaprenyl-diphosphate phosphatase [Halioxenophilus sp. WMMB6]|uniref:undecaprenyl-diphosphate phosphatase n=1 Tax=Halioxenophilus sp. WMMB6 TaxID=3073815 RepID=UPI00295E5D41|nr:undecaprenyl-diphosphate phosphatase [Halioxenophilus sp. WMMB6]